MQKDSFGYYGLIVKPSFDQAVDDAKKPLRIPIPDRAAKREDQSVYRAHLMEMSQKQTAAQMMVHDYQMQDDTLPVAALLAGPSDAGGDPVFQRMAEQAQGAAENAHAQVLQHQYEADATERLEGQRAGALHDTYAQGGGHPVIQGEHGSAALESFRIDSDNDEAPSSGHASPRDVRHPVRHGVALRAPIAAGRPAPPQFRTFREQNYGDRAPTSAAAAVQPGEDESYETMRLNSVVSRYLNRQ